MLLRRQKVLAMAPSAHDPKHQSRVTRATEYSIGARIERSVTETKLPELLRQRPNARVLSVVLLTRRDTFVHTCSVTENAVRAPILTPIFARLRGKGRNRSAYQAKYNDDKD